MIEEYTKQFIEQLDNDMYDFFEELAKQDKQLRVEYLDTKITKDNKNYIRTNYVIFFDSLSHPLSKSEINNLIRKEHGSKKEE